MKKDINIKKQKWFKNSLLTTVLVVIIITIFILVNFWVNKLDLNPIDVTKEKLYTLSEDSKSQVQKINEEVHIYFFGYDEANSTVILAKQYHEINEKISAEAIDITKRPDLAQKYGIDSNTSVGIIVESLERYKVLIRLLSDYIKLYKINNKNSLDSISGYIVGLFKSYWKH